MNRKIFDEISGRVMAFMTSPNSLLLEKIYLGGGKTTNTLMALEDNQYQWIYLAPFHTVIEENLRFSTLNTYNYLHLKSRAKVCIVPAYKEIAEMNVDIRPICEYSCPLKETTCPYYETKRQLWGNPISWAGVHHHLKEFLRDFFSFYIDGYRMSNYYDVLVIDENPISVLFENEIANAEMLGRLRQIIENLEMTHRHLVRVLRLIDYLILNFVGSTELDYVELLGMFRGISFGTFYDEYQQLLVEEIRRERIDSRYMPREYLRLFKVMSPQLTEENIPYMIIKKAASPYNTKKYHFMAFDNSSLLNCPIKIIGLDGTANQYIWEAITNRTASLLDRKYVYKNIYQLREKGNPAKNNSPYARYPLSSWIRRREISSTGKRLCALIDKICERKKNHNVFIVCTKPLKPIIEANIRAKNVVFGNYYYLRSRNDFYETCDTAILASEPNIQQFQLECFSELSGWDREVWRQIFTQEEMIQAVGRIRENLDVTERNRQRDPREIYIFPHTPPTNNINDTRPLYPECTIVTYSDILLLKNDIKNNILQIIKQNGSAFIYFIQKELKITRSFTKYLLEELERERKIIDEGRKGYFISD